MSICIGDKIYDVLDIDSSNFDRFSVLEEEYLVRFLDILNKHVDWKKLISI